MASTSAPASNLVSGYTELPGLRVGPDGGIFSKLKIYNFGITSTAQISATSTAISYTVDGLTTNDIPISLTPSTGVASVGAESMFVSASDTLQVTWGSAVGTSTAGIPGLAAPGAAYTLLTYAYYVQSPSTTT